MKPYYSENNISIYHGDCREIIPQLPKVDLVLTDPPYLTDSTGVPIRGGGVGERILDSNSVGMPWGYSLDWVEWCGALNPSHWLVYCNYRMLGGLQIAVERYAKLSCTFVWRKSNAARMTRPVPRLDCEFVLWLRGEKASCERMGEFDSMVLDVPMPQAGCFATERILEHGTGKAAHPCQKPIAIVQPFLSRLCNGNEVVLDPFLGTGSSLVAAKACGLSAIGIEIEEKYCEIAARRLSQEVLNFGVSQ